VGPGTDLGTCCVEGGNRPLQANSEGSPSFLSGPGSELASDMGGQPKEEAMGAGGSTIAAGSMEARRSTVTSSKEPSPTRSSGDAGAPRVLIVDDEPYITDLVATAMRYEGFEVAAAANGREALALVESFRPELLVLDVMLPDVDGFEVQRKLIDRGRRLPVLFLTARDATEDKVRGLTIGGDDYVTKPFSLEELIARIRAILRRVHGTEPESGRLTFIDLEMDEDTHEVWRAGKAVDLTATEFNLLRFLMENPRRVLSKSQILDHVWNYDFGGDSSIVETYISYLRKKIDVVEPHLIHTVRGVGYVLRAPSE
jgi:two-component system, OmpR family, response regulator